MPSNYHEPIPALTIEAQLKRKVRSHLNALGFQKEGNGYLSPSNSEKSAIRELHAIKRAEKLQANSLFLENHLPNLIENLADGSEIDPSKIELSLRPVRTGSADAQLFRSASLTWSVPVSNGFGRRMRYLVWDEHHDRLAGLLALGDPVFNLAARDRAIGWTSVERAERLCNVLDAYVLGALPPYNMLLCGKAIACLIRSRDLQQQFETKYGQSKGIISRKQKHPKLLAVTTSSSMGRSSVYNRLKLGGEQYLKPLGYTTGWGHFHIPDDLFSDLRSFLQDQNHRYADQFAFGEGPNWRIRLIKEAFRLLGLPQNLLHHGVRRQVFIAFMAPNAEIALKTGVAPQKDTDLITVSEINELAKIRWIVPRSQRNASYRFWKKGEIRSLFVNLDSENAVERSKI
ncbi:MAG: Druantia anti-phage system protein DruA [Erythrobacter sp.]|uniref:Druantia anti-phage system protein DruA n=1 Tax=Erythrobacter sp. TaxID=1042 RepID=UPI00329900F3